MKATITTVLSMVLSLFLLSPSTSHASHDQIECSSNAPKVKAVGIQSTHIANVNFSATNGGFDPVPLLRTTVNLSQTGCLIAHFSAIPRPTDNHIVFQVRVDGVPMIGHVPGLFGTPTPAVSEPNQTDEWADVPRMAAYNFFKMVPAGIHTIEVLYAACCSPVNLGPSFVDAATLTLEYQ